MQLPTIDHPTGRPNFTEISVGSVDLRFSYRTVISFRGPGEPSFVTRCNDWGPTTGKHLNYCQPDKTLRVSGQEFEERLTDMLARLELVNV